jgi:23S rRNA pseudouridine2604 synthase
MTTIKLNKNAATRSSAGHGRSNSHRAPVRGAGNLAKSRPSWAQVQAERAERDIREVRHAPSERSEPDHSKPDHSEQRPQDTQAPTRRYQEQPYRNRPNHGAYQGSFQGAAQQPQTNSWQPPPRDQFDQSGQMDRGPQSEPQNRDVNRLQQPYADQRPSAFNPRHSTATPYDREFNQRDFNQRAFDAGAQQSGRFSQTIANEYQPSRDGRQQREQHWGEQRGPRDEAQQQPQRYQPRHEQHNEPRHNSRFEPRFEPQRQPRDDMHGGQRNEQPRFEQQRHAPQRYDNRYDSQNNSRNDPRASGQRWDTQRTPEGGSPHNDRYQHRADGRQNAPYQSGYNAPRTEQRPAPHYQQHAQQHRQQPYPQQRYQPQRYQPQHRQHHDDDDGEDDHFEHVEHAPGSMRLSKRIGQMGLASRREADDWISRGWVQVDGKVVDELGSRVMPNQIVTVHTKAKHQQAQRVTVLINKPVGYVSGQAEDGYEPAFVLVKPENQWQEDKSGLHLVAAHLKKLVPAGRLDIDSTGLLVLTQDGRIAKQLIGEDVMVEKEYLVRVATAGGVKLSDENLALLRHGLELDDEALLPAQVEWVNEDQLRFVLKQGKKRQIRRMCEAVGMQVLGLKRVRIGSVMLGDLPTGSWRYLRKDESFS